MKPTQILSPFPHVEIRLFGRNSGATDWSIRSLNANTLQKPTSEAVRAFHQIQGVVAETGIKNVYAPTPAFSAKACRPEDLRVQFSSNDDAMREADFPDNWSWVLCRGKSADVCEVPKSSALWFSSADCPTLVVTNRKRKRVICAHCGYRSLADLKRLKTGTPSREHFSVVDTVFQQFHESPNELEAFITLGIREHFSEASPEELRVLKEYEDGFASDKSLPSFFLRRGLLDIVKLVEEQCINRGINRVQNDWNDTFEQNSRWWSYERAMRQKDTAGMLKRNGVMVIHHAI